MAIVDGSSNTDALPPQLAHMGARAGKVNANNLTVKIGISDATLKANRLQRPIRVAG